jgi:hypothetical protein
MAGQDAKAETKAYTGRRPQDDQPPLVRSTPPPCEVSIGPDMDGAVPASADRPTDPVSGANPFPEVTDLFCRLPLPTLFYRLEAAHLGDLMRISVRCCMA